MSASKPTVVVVGRPNVGKSTLVNRLLGRREAIVEEKPGVTRDFKSVDVEWRGRSFTLIDTGGWLETGNELDVKVSKKAERAIANADLALLTVDATVGVTEDDDRVALLLRRMKRSVLLVANKVDSGSRDSDIWAFSRLGVGEPWGVSALHGRGAGDLLDEIVERLPPESDFVEAAPEPTTKNDEVFSIALAGRPNVGKSTLFNRLIGEDRSIVHDFPGTTRDAIDTVVDTPDGPLRFIDTAGMRRKSRMDEGTEFYSMVRSLQAIDRANAALLLIDSTEGVTHQDQRLAERIDAAGSPVVIVLNKWDLASTEQREKITAEVADKLAYLGYAPVLKVSALTGLGTNKLLPALREAGEAYGRRIPTADLNKVLQAAQASHPPPKGRILYAVQGAADPPTFTIFVNHALPQTYMRYLERMIREHFNFGPTPLKIRVRNRSS